MEKQNPPPYTEANAYPQLPPQDQQQPGFYPPQSYPQQPNQPQGQVVMITAPPIIATFGPGAQILTCPHCHHQITSRVETEASTKTHLFALILCLFGCVPCCLIPYCTDSCQNRNHYCPSCGAFLGAYSD